MTLICGLQSTGEIAALGGGIALVGIVALVLVGIALVGLRGLLGTLLDGLNSSYVSGGGFQLVGLDGLGGEFKKDFCENKYHQWY